MASKTIKRKERGKKKNSRITQNALLNPPNLSQLFQQTRLTSPPKLRKARPARLVPARRFRCPQSLPITKISHYQNELSLSFVSDNIDCSSFGYDDVRESKVEKNIASV